MQGTIRNLNPDRQFAFIVCGANRDIFLHKKEFKGNWKMLLDLYKRGTVSVEFDVIETDKGLQAIQAKLV